MVRFKPWPEYQSRFWMLFWMPFKNWILDGLGFQMILVFWVNGIQIPTVYRGLRVQTTKRKPDLWDKNGRCWFQRTSLRFQSRRRLRFERFESTEKRRRVRSGDPSEDFSSSRLHGRNNSINLFTLVKGYFINDVTQGENDVFAKVYDPW